MQVVERVDQAAAVVHVLRERIAERAGLVVVHHHRSTGRAEINVLAAHVHRLVVIEAVPDPFLGRRLDCAFHDAARQVNASVVVDPPAHRRRRLDELVEGIAHADVFEQPEGGVVHLLHLALGQRFESARGQARADRPAIALGRSFADGDAASPAAAAAAPRCLARVCLAHDRNPRFCGS